MEIVQKRKLMAAAVTTGMFADMSNSPILPDNIRFFLVLSFSMVTAGFFMGAIFLWLHQENMARITMPLRVVAMNHSDNWNASIRTDRITDPDYVCVYRVFYTVSHDEVQKVENDNVTTYTGEVIRVQDEDIRSTEISCQWIGKNGEEADSNIWKNVFAKKIKMRNRGRISVVHCGYLRQEHI